MAEICPTGLGATERMSVRDRGNYGAQSTLKMQPKTMREDEEVTWLSSQSPPVLSLLSHIYPGKNNWQRSVKNQVCRDQGPEALSRKITNASFLRVT